MSLATMLANKAKEIKINPDAAPLQPEEAAIAVENRSHLLAPKLPKAIEVPKGAYLALRQQYLIMADGTKVYPANGYFVPASQEQYDMLEYFDAKQQGLVELVK